MTLADDMKSRCLEFLTAVETVEKIWDQKKPSRYEAVSIEVNIDEEKKYKLVLHTHTIALVSERSYKSVRRKSDLRRNPYGELLGIYLDMTTKYPQPEHVTI